MLVLFFLQLTFLVLHQGFHSKSCYQVSKTCSLYDGLTLRSNVNCLRPFISKSDNNSLCKLDRIVTVKCDRFICPRQIFYNKQSVISMGCSSRLTCDCPAITWVANQSIRCQSLQLTSFKVTLLIFNASIASFVVCLIVLFLQPQYTVGTNVNNQ